MNIKNTTAIGQKAEDAAAKHLIKLGYKILNRNYKNRYCEIDIVASKDKIIYFVEVKYRSSVTSGDGLDALTAKKVQQMTFAAEIWVSENKWSGDYQLAAVSLSGLSPTIDKLVLI